MNESLSRRLMDLPPEARPGFTMPTSPPQRGDEHLPAREHETGILWHYSGPVPATPTTCALYPWRWLPDLDDAGSWGRLLKCAREVHQAPRLGVHWFDGDDDHPSPFNEPGWIVDLGDGENVVCGATEYEEALVCAIEDAAGASNAADAPKHERLTLDIEVEQESEGRWIAEVMGVAGCLVYGTTREEAIEKVARLAAEVRAATRSSPG